MMTSNRYFPVVSIVAANLIPLVGVLFWGWSLTVILVIFWFENLIIGGVNILRMIRAIGTVGVKVKTILFFCVHYGGFWLAHGLFLFVTLIPAIKDNPAIGQTVVNTDFNVQIKFALLGLLASNLFIFIQDVRAGATRARLPVQVQMFAPYGRVMILHITILFGSYLAAQYASSLWVVVLITVLKIIGDVVFWIFSQSLFKTGEALSTLENPRATDG